MSIKQNTESIIILVTGGAGFMGSNFIRYILSKYLRYHVVNLDKLSYAGNLDNLIDIENNPRYKFILGDISDDAIVRNIFKLERPHIVVNYAAETLVDRSIAGPKIFVESNIVGTQNLLEAAREFPIKKFVQVSTDEVYGEILSGKAPETTVCHPRNPYAATKAGADHLVISYVNTYDIPAVITRSCNFYGPNQYPEKLIPIFITNLLENREIFIHGDGGQTREWIYTEDHCRAIDKIIQKGKIGEIYNIGTSQNRTIIQIAEIILKLLGKDKKVMRFTKDRPGNDRRYALNWNKLAGLGWEPMHIFDKGIRLTVDWYKKNEKWWRKIKQMPEFDEYYKHKYLNVQ